MNPRHSIRRRGGLAATFELHADGFDRNAIAQAVAAGTIVRARQGWYAEPGIADELLRAARVGGRATCATALALRGIWVLRDPQLHVAVEANATQLRHSRNKNRRLASDRSPVRIHWTDHRSSRSRLIVDDVQALCDFAHCASPEFVGASAESLVHERPVLLPAIRRLARTSTPPLAKVLAFVDGTSESGTEFLVRWRLRAVLDASLQQQVEIVGVGWVDFVIGRRLVVEVDGFTYHVDPERFESDRRRDAVLSTLGYRVLRFSHRQVIDMWPLVESAIAAAVARGDPW